MLKGIWNESQHIKAHIRSLAHVFATKLPGGHSVRGPKFGARSSGPDSCGTGMPKNIWLHHQSSHTCASTCLCYKVAWGHSVRGPKFGAQSSGPEDRGPKFGAWSSGPDSCGTGMPKNIWLHHQSSHTCASTCLCYKVAWGALCSGPAVRGPKFGARLLWHRYAKKHLITSSEFTYMCFCVHAFATKLPGGTLFGAWSSGPDSCGIGME